MSEEEEGGPTIGEREGSSPNRDDRDRGRDGMTGDASMKGGEPSPGGGGEASAGDRDAIDLEAVRDRAS